MIFKFPDNLNDYYIKKNVRKRNRISRNPKSQNNP